MNEQDYTPIPQKPSEEAADQSSAPQDYPATPQAQPQDFDPSPMKTDPSQSGSQAGQAEATGDPAAQPAWNHSDLFSDSGVSPRCADEAASPDQPSGEAGQQTYRSNPIQTSQSIPPAMSPIPPYSTTPGAYGTSAGQDAYTYARPSNPSTSPNPNTADFGAYNSSASQPAYGQAGGYPTNAYSRENASQSGYPGGTGSYYPPVPASKPPKKKSKGLLAFFVVLLCVAVAAGGMTVAYYVGRNNGQDLIYSSSGDASYVGSIDVQVQEKPASSEGENPDGSLSVTSVVEKMKASVVSITVYSPDGSAGSQASGMILSEDGYILTNDHIYKDIPSAKFMITLNNGEEYSATFVAGDSRSDIAILKMENVGGLQPVTFGKSSQCEVGEQVVAIGNSAGLVDTVTVGYISALNRRISSSSGGYTSKYIQTDTAINPGNSGGPLVNLYGQVIGINSSKIAEVDSEGICFAIPSDDALSIVENLLANGQVTGRAKLGITYTEISTVAAEINNCPAGLYIASISEDSDLYGKDISQGDIITHINGKEITSSNQVLDIIDDAKAGDAISLTIYKSATGSSVTISTRLVEYVGTSNYTTPLPSNLCQAPRCQTIMTTMMTAVEKIS